MDKAISNMEYKCLNWSLVSFTVLILLLAFANALNLEESLTLRSMSLVVGTTFSVSALYLWVCAILRTVKSDLPIVKKVIYLLVFFTLTFFASTYYYFYLRKLGSVSRPASE